MQRLQVVVQEALLGPILFSPLLHRLAVVEGVDGILHLPVEMAVLVVGQLFPILRLEQALLDKGITVVLVAKQEDKSLLVVVVVRGLLELLRVLIGGVMVELELYLPLQVLAYFMRVEVGGEQPLRVLEELVLRAAAMAQIAVGELLLL